MVTHTVADSPYIRLFAIVSPAIRKDFFLGIGCPPRRQTRIDSWNSFNEQLISISYPEKFKPQVNRAEVVFQTFFFDHLTYPVKWPGGVAGTRLLIHKNQSFICLPE